MISPLADEKNKVANIISGPKSESPTFSWMEILPHEPEQGDGPIFNAFSFLTAVWPPHQPHTTLNNNNEHNFAFDLLAPVDVYRFDVICQ